MAKLADALALGASGVTHGGSSPLLGTFESYKKTELMFGLFVYLVTVIDVVDLFFESELSIAVAPIVCIPALAFV